MKATSPKSRVVIALLGMIGLTGAAQAQVTVDGIRNAGEYTGIGAVAANQATVSNWNDADELGSGTHEALANLQAIQDGDDLAVHLAARVKNRGIILFIDSKADGRNFIPSGLINFGGEVEFINNLGFDGSSGMTFESGFDADYAIRIFGDGGSGAFVNLYDLNTRTRIYAGNAGAADITNQGPIQVMRASGLGTTAISANTTAYASANNGVEMKLDLAALGVPSGSQTVKLMALLVTSDSTYASNQVLASKTSSSSDIGSGVNTFNFESETGIQTVPVNVTGPASRPVVFSVNMNQEIAKGFFSAVNDRVKVLFFSGVASPMPGEIFLTDDDANGIYTGTLLATGTEGDAFGTYKFVNTRGTPNGGFEYGDNRTFNLGALDVTQALPTDDFRTSYTVWANEFSEGQSANQDKDGDGIANGIEYFMGSNNSQFTANPSPVSGVITWPRIADSSGVAFKVEVSSNLSSWQDAAVAYPANLDTSNPLQVVFTLPPGAGKIFARLSVIP